MGASRHGATSARSVARTMEPSDDVSCMRRRKATPSRVLALGDGRGDQVQDERPGEDRGEEEDGEHEQERRAQ
ncbi:hypothetical protein ASNO1_06670 [Corallococcus caeni]|uniref:Uncharacterized protein n=1 Tax=Corallococcus caeni TaxID=3082388 RepID=A0ABQ6QK72_9BACT|nr:hypothetical protein ASNO1_06670 [Corallococcus sp. NO1]